MGVLGTVSVNPKYISYFGGFFLFPTQVLLRVSGADQQPGQTVSFAPGQDLGARTAFFQTEGIQPAVKRSLLINGGLFNEKTTLQEPKAFIYAFNSRAFPNTPVLRPRLNTVEEWSFVNYNNDEHPIHIHVNDFQVIAEFMVFDGKYTGGVSLASDWTSCQEGGAQMVVVGQRSAPGEVRAYSSGCALDGYPSMYNESPSANHNGPVKFRSVLKFTPFQASQGVAVATTSTPGGADLLVSASSRRGQAEVRKYLLRRASPKATTLSAKLVGKLESVAGEAATLGGD